MNTRRHRHRLGIAAVILLGACDPIYQVMVAAPLVAPVDSVCLRESLGRLTGRPAVWPYTAQLAAPSGDTLARVWYRNGWSDLGQVQFRDSTTQLMSTSGRIGVKYTRAEAAAVAESLGAFLLAVRDACNGTTPAGVAPVAWRASHLK